MSATASQRGRVPERHRLTSAADRPLRLIGYVRCSTREQAVEGLSIQAQRHRLDLYARTFGHELVAIEDDSGTSGTVDPLRREGLARALAMLAKGEADGLLFAKLDRVGRSVKHVLALADTARRQSWHLMSVGENLDTSSASGKLIFTMLCALAEMEAAQVAERTRVGMEQVCREGRVRSRIVPFGYRVKGALSSTAVKAGGRGRLVEHPDEQRLLRRITRLADEHGARYIARYLNERGQCNPRTGRAWNRSTLAAIIRTAARRARALAA
jgi:site-specific DNA recombinase